MGLMGYYGPHELGLQLHAGGRFQGPRSKQVGSPMSLVSVCDHESDLSGWTPWHVPWDFDIFWTTGFPKGGINYTVHLPGPSKRCLYMAS